MARVGKLHPLIARGNANPDYHILNYHLPPINKLQALRKACELSAAHVKGHHEAWHGDLRQYNLSVSNLQNA